jgi:hypothetical protein
MMTSWMQSDDHLKTMTWISHLLFNNLVRKMLNIFNLITTKRTIQKSRFILSSLKCEIGVFFTLFWMAHYLTILLMFSLFNIYERLFIRILKRTINTMAKVLKLDIK